MDYAVVAAFLVVSLLEIAVPIALAFWLSKKFKLGKKLFLYGTVFFVAVQVLHAPLVSFAQEPFMEFVSGYNLGRTANITALALFLGLLAGLFEEIGRFIVFSRFFKSKKIKTTKKNGVLFGLGWGGIESILVGVLVLLTLVSYMSLSAMGSVQISEMLSTAGLEGQQLEAATGQINTLKNISPLEILPGLLERAMTITLHIAWTLLVLAAVNSGKKPLLVLAILWHSAVDFAAVLIAYGLGNLWLAELAIFLFFLPAAYYIKKTAF